MHLCTRRFDIFPIDHCSSAWVGNQWCMQHKFTTPPFATIWIQTVSITKTLDLWWNTRFVPMIGTWGRLLITDRKGTVAEKVQNGNQTIRWTPSLSVLMRARIHQKNCISTCESWKLPISCEQFMPIVIKKNMHKHFAFFPGIGADKKKNRMTCGL